MGLMKTDDGYRTIGANFVFPDDPFFIHCKTLPPRPKRGPIVCPVFPEIVKHDLNGLHYRLAGPMDLPAISAFTDFWLAGGAAAKHIPGAGTDFFIPFGRLKCYLEKYTTVIVFDDFTLIAWAVRTKLGVLIHLLVDPNHRGQGIGSHLLELLTPATVRSKSDQSTGDPLQFYVSHGFTKADTEKTGKKKNIDVLKRNCPGVI